MNYSAKQWVRVLLQCSACGSGFIAFVFAALNHAVTASVTMKTSLGFMEIELYDIALTVTVANFLKHVEGDYFDEAELYRVVT